MKKFIFKFQSILDFRQREEQILQKELAQLRSKLDEAFQIMQSLQEEKDQVVKAMQHTQETVYVASRLTEFLQYIHMIKNKTLLQQDAIIRLQNQVAKKRNKLIQAKKNKEVLENLKEKYYTDWKKSYERIQASTLDEIATIRYQHQQLGLHINE